MMHYMCGQPTGTFECLWAKLFVPVCTDTRTGLIHKLIFSRQITLVKCSCSIHAHDPTIFIIHDYRLSAILLCGKALCSIALLVSPASSVRWPCICVGCPDQRYFSKPPAKTGNKGKSGSNRVRPTGFGGPALRDPCGISSPAAY